MTFKELGLHAGLIEGLEHMNFENATPIQEQAIPLILEGKDLIACAQTGTGKTGAYILPTLHMLANSNSKGTKVVIVCPTRELALQIDQQIMGFAYFLGLHSIPIYGGGDGSEWDQQKTALTRGADIIVATPGKLISYLNLGHFDFSNVTHFILDEADRMMDMGFREDIVRIAKALPQKRQNLMFSATMPDKIRKLIKELLHEPAQINLALSKPAEGVLQAAYLVRDEHKPALIAQLIKEKSYLQKVVVFTSTKSNVGTIVRALKAKGFKTGAISSDYQQTEREEVMQQFASGQINVLVGTDVISRGIDIKDINLVINYDVPPHAEDYVHRVGRTARAETTGVAITLINEKDMYAFSEIEKLIDKEIYKMNLPPEIGISPEWKIRTRAEGGGHHGGPKRPSSGGQGGNNKKRPFKKFNKPKTNS
ncbi:MAG: DEAD/DEAH box helicase [Saprospiraceae bacterium]